MTLPKLAVVLLASLLSGCAAPDDPPATSPSSTATQSPDASARLAAMVQEEEPLEPVTVTCGMRRTNLGTSTGFGLFVDRAFLGITDCGLEDLFDGNLSWGRAMLIEADWTPQASQTGAELYIESDACPPAFPPGGCPQPYASGASAPLSLRLDDEELRRQEGQGALVLVHGQGVVVDLEFTLYLTLFPDEEPVGFTAIP